MMYRALLHLYPHDFRQKFADELEADFIDLCADARASRRPLALTRCWVAALRDLAASVPREWLRTPWVPVLAAAAAIACGIFYYVVGRVYQVRSFVTTTTGPESPDLLLLMALMTLIPAATMILIVLAARFARPAPREPRRHV